MKKILYTLICLLAATQARAQWQVIDSITAGNYTSVHFFDAYNGIISGEMEGRFLKTKDGGQTWDTVQVPYLDWMTDHLTDMQFATKDVGVVCGGSPFSAIPNILLRTKDGGNTWDSMMVTSHPVYEFSGVDIKATASDVEGVVFSYNLLFRITDSGKTLTNMVKPKFNLNIQDAIYTGYSVLIAGYDFGTNRYELYTTNDWGQNWSLAFSDSVTFSSISVSGAYGLAAGTDGWILKSQDGGKSWSKQKIAGDSVSFNKVKFGANGYPYLLAYNSVVGGAYIFGSDNFGQSWHSILVDPTNWFTDISVPATATGYVLTNSKLYKTTTGGGLGLSVDEHKEMVEKIAIYPNPVHDKLGIKIPNEIKTTGISLYDVHGRFMKHAAHTGQYIDVSGYARGVYFLEIRTEDSKYRRKLLLQ